MPLGFVFDLVLFIILMSFLAVVAGVVRVEALSPLMSVFQTLALLWEFAGTQVAALSWLTKFPLKCFFPVIVPIPLKYDHLDVK